MYRTLISAALAMLSLAAPAQTVKGISLGMTIEQVESALGKPTRFYDAGTHTFSDRLPAIVGGALWECYRRVTAIQEYEVRVNYATDASASRLHPALRVAQVTIMFDKPVKYTDALRDSPEVRLLCAGGCHTGVVQYKVLAGTKAGSDYAVISDAGRNASLMLECTDVHGKSKPILRPEDEVTMIHMEPYFDPGKYSEILDYAEPEKTFSSATWPPVR